MRKPKIDKDKLLDALWVFDILDDGKCCYACKNIYVSAYKMPCDKCARINEGVGEDYWEPDGSIPEKPDKSYSSGYDVEDLLEPCPECGLTGKHQSTCTIGGQWDEPIHTGMTLRDYFAAKAMQAELQSDTAGNNEKIASWSYSMADAMLAERDKKK